MTLYDDLGVDKAADKATIKRAYRKRAQKDHPDKGGDKDKFHQIQRAYDVLGNDARRAHYDAHGVDGQQDKQNAIVQRFAALFMSLVESQDADHTDLVAAMKNALARGKQTVQGEIRTHEQKIVKYEKIRTRITKKNGGENLFVQMLDGQIGIFRRGLELGKVELATVDEMTKLLDDYKYQTDVMGPQQARMQYSSIFEALSGSR